MYGSKQEIQKNTRNLHSAICKKKIGIMLNISSQIPKIKKSSHVNTRKQLHHSYPTQFLKSEPYIQTLYNYKFKQISNLLGTQEKLSTYFFLQKIS